MLPDIQPGNTKILYFFNCLLDGMHTIGSLWKRLLCCANQDRKEKLCVQAKPIWNYIFTFHFA